MTNYCVIYFNVTLILVTSNVLIDYFIYTYTIILC